MWNPKMVCTSIVAHWSEPFILILVILGSRNYVLAADGHLECPKIWQKGANITLKCYYNNSTCASDTDLTSFSKGSNKLCSTANSICYSPDSGDHSEKCWCQKVNSTFVMFVYSIWADPNLHNGSWTCERSCSGTTISPTPQTFTADSSCNNNVIAKPTPVGACAAGIQTAVIEPERSEAVCLEKPKEDTTWKEIAIAFIVITAVCVIAFLIIIIIKMRNKEEKQMIAFRAKVLDAFPAKKNVTCTDTELKITGDNYNEIFKGVVKVLKIMLVEFDKTFTLTREEWPQPKNVDKFTQNVQKRIANIKTVTAKNTEVKITGANYDEIFKGVVEVWIIMVDEYENDR